MLKGPRPPARSARALGSALSCALLAALLSAAGGCRRGPRTPEEALARLETAVATADPVALYDVLDDGTRAAIAGAYEAERLQRTLIEAKFPRAQAGAALARLEAAAEPDAKRYFVRLARERRLAEGYRKRLGAVSGTPSRKPDEAGVWLVRPEGMPFHFRQTPGGAWGFDELRAEWAFEHERQKHAVETVRENAELYRKAGAP